MGQVQGKKVAAHGPVQGKEGAAFGLVQVKEELPWDGIGSRQERSCIGACSK